jgi:hypothetical protein
MVITTGSGGAHNKWWLYTDLDSGRSRGWISAYYLRLWGDDVAKDNNGVDIPLCP